MPADLNNLRRLADHEERYGRKVAASFLREVMTELESLRAQNVGGDVGDRKAAPQPEMTETQFVVQIAGHIMREGSMLARKALPLASTAYDAFLKDCKIEFGDAAYAWDEAAAAAIGREYETRFWPAGRASGSVGQNVG